MTLNENEATPSGYPFTLKEIRHKAYLISLKYPENDRDTNWYAAIKELEIEWRLKSKRGEEIFSLYRDYAKHEQALIHNRTTWLITIQSFLIATFGFTYQNRFNFLNSLYSNYLSNLSQCSSQTPSSVCSGKIPNKILENLTSLYPEIRETNEKYIQFFILLSSIGIITSLIAFFSILAAQLASESLRDNWYYINDIPKKKNKYTLRKWVLDIKSVLKEIMIWMKKQTFRVFTFWFLLPLHPPPQDRQVSKNTYANLLEVHHLPGIVGGGSERANLFGKGLSWFLPLCFSGFWLVVIVQVFRNAL